MNLRLPALFIALLTAALIAGCAKTNDAASTGTDASASGDAVAEGGEGTEVVSESDASTTEEAPAEAPAE